MTMRAGLLRAEGRTRMAQPRNLYDADAHQDASPRDPRAMRWVNPKPRFSSRTWSDVFWALNVPMLDLEQFGYGRVW